MKTKECQYCHTAIELKSRFKQARTRDEGYLMPCDECQHRENDDEGMPCEFCTKEAADAD